LYKLTVLGEEYRIWSSSLCNFNEPPVTFLLVGVDISSTPSSEMFPIYL
jgi:hypothetical protein